MRERVKNRVPDHYGGHCVLLYDRYQTYDMDRIYRLYRCRRTAVVIHDLHQMAERKGMDEDTGW